MAGAFRAIGSGTLPRTANPQVSHDVAHDISLDVTRSSAPARALGYLLLGCSAFYLAYVLADLLEIVLPDIATGSIGGGKLVRPLVHPLLVSVSLGNAYALAPGLRFLRALMGPAMAALSLAGLAVAPKMGPRARLVAYHLAFWSAFVYLVLGPAGVIYRPLQRAALFYAEGWMMSPRGLGVTDWQRSMPAVVPLVAGLVLLLVIGRRLTDTAMECVGEARASVAGRGCVALAVVFAPFAVLILAWLYFPPVSALHTPMWLLMAANALLPGALAVAGAMLVPARESREGQNQRGTVRRMALLPMLALLWIVATSAYPAVVRWRAEAALAEVSSAHYRIAYRSADYTEAKVRAFAEERERMWPEIAARLGGAPAPAPDRKIQVYLYASFDEKVESGHGRHEFDAEGTKGAIAAIWNDAFPNVEPVADARILLERQWGKPAHPFLALAAAAHAAGTWRGRPVADWAAEITAQEGPPTLELLASADAGTDGEENFLSPLVRTPLAGEFASWIAERWGAAELHKLYSNASGPVVAAIAQSLGINMDALEAEWRAHLMAEAKSYAADEDSARKAQSAAAIVAARVALPQTSGHAPFFQRGVAFTQERWRDGGDYASSKIGEVLAPLKKMGVDAISVSPFAYMPGVGVPDLVRFSGESDEGIANVTFVAHRLGMRVMLKPQIWLRGGVYSGNIHFRSAADRELWFAKYRRWIYHYARLAEENHSDLLSLGNELGEMAGYEREWREIIRTVRRIYHGPLTYSAHWGEEFEKAAFWDALDYIGLNNYYPLVGSSGGDSSAATLLQGAEEVLRRVEDVQRRAKRPVIFTEAGFPSRHGGLKEPWNETMPATVDTAEQARGYEAVFRAFYSKPWFYGMYWWKWYSTGAGGGPDDLTTTPMNKPAAAVMARWYLGPERREP
jgi:hypothetical protein